MVRPLRIDFEGAWYHVMNRGINKANIYFNDKHRSIFLKFLEKTSEIYNIEIHAYCLMDNHYHLVVHTPRANLSQAMQYLNSNYAQIVNKDMNRDGPLFKGRFRAILVSADDYLIQVSRYIHLNPIEANMVTSLNNYKWSSYPAYLGKVISPNWLNTEEIKKRFCVKNFEIKYKNFVESSHPLELSEIYRDKRIKPVLGSDDFCQKIDNYVNTHSLSGEIADSDRIIEVPSIHKIITFVSKHFNIEREAILEIRKGGNFPRQIAIYICRKLGGFKLQEIAEVMGIQYKSVSKSINRVDLEPEHRKIAVEIMNGVKSRHPPSQGMMGDVEI